MLDRSLEFHTVIMKHPNDRPPAVSALPEGFSERFYEKGDEKAWARLQTAVGEFGSEEDALLAFRHYLPFEEELRKRQIYLIDDRTGTPAASATAWFIQSGDREIGTVHALCCLPEYQSRSLGKAVALRMMSTFYRLMPGREVWLDTQTWSYRAIGLYLDMGFAPMKTAVFNEARNEFAAAASVLREKMRADKYRQFLDMAR